MRYKRVRTTLALVIAVPLAIAVAGCASVQHDPLYDGEIIPQVPSADTVTFIPFVLENHRTIDLNPPHILFISFGRRDLGIVQGYGTALRTMIDTRWIAADGCIQIVAHYVGTGDLVFDRFCWRKGERITASLDNIFVAGSAWSRR